MIRHALLALGALALVACDDTVDVRPPPAALTRDATGHYCRMIVADHPGPKAQIFIAGQSTPLWFPSVRDMLAYTMLPEETAKVVAIYVSDTGQAESFEHPAPDAWLPAENALYVLGSDQVGGMGVAEAVPFADGEAAGAFVAAHGGEVVGFAEVPLDWVFAEVGLDEAPGRASAP